MVLAARPVITELKVPPPAPSLVLVESATVGLGAISQTTPLAVTAADPSALMVPPELAPVVDREEAAVVLRVGNTMDGAASSLFFLQEVKRAADATSARMIFFMVQK